MNSTTSEPSRSTASPTTRTSAVIGRLPAVTAAPTAAISAAISRPWRAIQAVCHISITTAAPSTLALSNSWPEPSNALAIASANRATMPAPSVPSSTPAATQCPRPLMPRVAASTMPMIRPASITSRKTMMSAPNMLLFRDHDAFGGVGIELADELVAARGERSDAHQAFGLAGNDLLDLERGALEFLGGRILVGDIDGHALARRHTKFLRLELVIADDEVEFLRKRLRARHAENRQQDCHCKSAHHVCRPVSSRVISKASQGMTQVLYY